jgi:glyoxylase-like metal-dependent hydrolase (beta-lactamase superfamily II)
LGALEKMAAMKARAQHEMALEKSAGAFENGKDFLLLGIHLATLRARGKKTKTFLLPPHLVSTLPTVVIEYAPLEDELGDVLDKAMRHRGLSGQELADKAGVATEKIRDAVDYRNDLSTEEISRLASVLMLNDVGLQALSQSHYPLPEIAGLPFCLHPLRMAHGIGVANAYVVAECGGTSGLLFDTGPDYAQLRRVWPKTIKRIDAVFLTHAETEHIGGLAGLRAADGRMPVFGPIGCGEDRVTALGESGALTFGNFEVRVLQTPGHSEAHNSYVIRVPKISDAPALLVSGDLIFAGSVGGAFYCHRRLTDNIRRLMVDLPDTTVIAPGHGPLTTIKNERMFNPFVL